MARTAVGVAPENDTQEKAPLMQEVSEEDSDNEVVVKSIHGEFNVRTTIELIKALLRTEPNRTEP